MTSLGYIFIQYDCFFFNLNLFILIGGNYFTILHWFCHTSTWICNRCTHVPNPEPPSHLPPHTIPLGHPSAPAPSILYPVSKWTGDSFLIWYLHVSMQYDCCVLEEETKTGTCTDKRRCGDKQGEGIHPQSQRDTAMMCGTHHFLFALIRNQPCQHLDFRLLTCIIVKK